MAGCGCEVEIRDKSQRKLLIVLLLINASMFVVEITVGWMAESTGLIADSLDMLADAVVYGISIYAVGKALAAKARAAQLSGYFQVALAVGVAFDLIRRVVLGSDPVSSLMMIVGGVALLANLICLVLIYKHRQGEVHMRASWIFSTNDVLANIGVILSGWLVMVLDSRVPDLLIGVLITLLVLRGGVRIIRDAKLEMSRPSCAE